MRHTASFLWLFTILSVQAGQWTNYVNPFIGTGAVENSLSGNCFPGATIPLGMVQLSPDTQAAPEWDKASGYDYNDSHLCGFSHTRLSGTGACDLIDLLLMPTVGGKSQSPADNVWSVLDHSKEMAKPGYYQIELEDGVRAELTATTRTGLHRYTYPQGQRQRLLIDLDHSAPKGNWQRRIIQSQLHVVSPTVVEGYRIITGWAKLRRIYFHIELSSPITKYELLDGHRNYGQTHVVNGTALKLWLDFNSPSSLIVKVSLSTTSIENARLNMDQEARSWDFDKYVSEADRAWDDMLGRIEVSGNQQDMVKFYTALYHVFIQPNTMSDVNGDFTATDYSTRRMPTGQTYYSTFSLWDTFRAAHPLYTLIAPTQNKGFINAMLVHYDTYGYLPIWDLWGQDNYCMIGNHAIPVVVDALLKDSLLTSKEEMERWIDACITSSTVSHPGSPFDVWEQYGYMPEDLQSQSVSITLEQSFDDWCVAQLARRLGHQDVYERFMQRSQYYRNLFNPETGFFQARTSDGLWLEPFDPLQYGANGGNPYTEGNAWQWSWYVPHDINALISLYGGKKQFAKRLDCFFSLTDQSGEKNSNASGFIGQYVQGNEPNHHVAYLYNYAGEPQKTQSLVHKICDELYTTNSNGYAGNDDCGEMSSWFIFSALGFYPVNPVGGEYVIGTPLFDKAVIHLPNGRDFSISVHRSRHDAYIIKAMRLNGRKFTDYTLTHAAICQGGLWEINI